MSYRRRHERRRGSWGYSDYGDYYLRSDKAPVESGGIRARSKRGDFGESWWSKRWLTVLSDILEANRLPRGRTYARNGRVRSLEIQPGLVTASVQGSRLYKVRIELGVLAPKDWKKLAAHFSEDASLVATLLNGELPAEAEQIFKDLAIHLLPRDEEDIQLGCNCPDWAVPCKHSAAIVYLIAEELDRDPFLLFLLRGMKRDDFLKMLDAAPALVALPQEFPPTPLPHEHAQFWKPFDPRFAPIPGLRMPLVPAALAKRLGPFPFWQGDSPFIETMEQLYANASANALARLNEAASVSPETASEE